MKKLPVKKLLPVFIIAVILSTMFSACGKAQTVSKSSSGILSDSSETGILKFPSASYIKSFMVPTFGAVTTSADHSADAVPYQLVVIMGVTADDLTSYRTQLIEGGMSTNADGTVYTLSDVKLVLDASVTSEVKNANYIKISIYPQY